jgi:predicted dehydrogenase
MIVRNRVGFAVVGLGSIAKVAVLPSFAACKNAKLVAVVSRDRQKARRTAREFDASSSYTNDEYAACLANPEVSAVYIATPSGEHVEFTVRAAQAGKHVLCEKPLAASVQQSFQMVEACRRSGVLLMTAYRKYYEPSTLYLKQLVQNGDLGRIDLIHTVFSELYNPGVSPAWLLDPKLAGGGPLTDLGVYCVNTGRWLAGEDPMEVRAQAWSHDQRRFREVEEGIAFQMRFPSGLMLQGSSTYGAAMTSFIYIQGAKGWVMLNPAYQCEDERRLTGKIAGRPVARNFKVLDEFALEIDAFASAIQQHRAIEPDGIQGHRDMIILDAIYQAAKTQGAVVVHY